MRKKCALAFLCLPNFFSNIASDAEHIDDDEGFNGDAFVAHLNSLFPFTIF